MTFLTTMFLKFFPGSWMIYAGILAASFAMGGTAAWKFQGARLDTVKAEFAGFVGQVKTVGEAAKKAATEQTARDKLAKERADRENKTATDKLRADLKRLRADRSNSNYLPTPTPGASSSATATINRAEFERAMGRLDTEVQGFLEIGDEAIVDLNSSKRWAAP